MSASSALRVIRSAANTTWDNAGFDFSLGADASARLDVRKSDASRNGSVDELACRASVAGGVVSSAVSASSDSAWLEGTVTEVRSVACRDLIVGDAASFVLLEVVSAGAARALSVIELAVRAFGDSAGINCGSRRDYTKTSRNLGLSQTGASKLVEEGALWAAHDEVEVEVVDLIVWETGRSPDFSTHGSQQSESSRVGDGEVDGNGIGYVVVVPVDHHLGFEGVNVDPVDFTGVHQIEELGSGNHFHVIDVDLISLTVSSGFQSERVYKTVSISSIPIELGDVSVI